MEFGFDILLFGCSCCVGTTTIMLALFMFAKAKFVTFVKLVMAFTKIHMYYFQIIVS
jgi:hypothetical protein